MIKINEDFLQQTYRFRLMHAQKERLDVSVGTNVPMAKENVLTDGNRTSSNRITNNLRKYVIHMTPFCHI